MRVLILTQVYWPDNVAVAQHLSDFCLALQRKGHEVKVITSRHAYEHKEIVYPIRENQEGIYIRRVRDTGFGKGSILGRMIDFVSYYVLCGFHTLTVNRKKYDLIIGLTSPPLLSYMGSFLAKFKRIPFLYWVMDLQPELSIQSGLLRESSWLAKLFSFLGSRTFRRSSHVVVLDEHMKKYALTKGGHHNKVDVCPVWPVMSELYEGERLSNPFRVKHKFGNRLVVMYSGNHAYVHPLTTILQVAEQLKDDDRFLFVFIGEGVAKKDVQAYREKGLTNIIQLPFQPREEIHISLSSADLQLVVMGSQLVGFTHPNKVYGAMFLGKPILYIGPEKSHVGDMFANLSGNISAEHGEIEKIIAALEEAHRNLHLLEITGKQNRAYAVEHFSPQVLIDRMVELAEETAR